MLLKNKSVKCDECGRLSRHDRGEYRRKDGSCGYICSQGRNCEHDYCEECETKHAPDYACPKCGIQPA